MAWRSRQLGSEPITLQDVLSYPMAPLAWLTGVSWPDARAVESLLGIKTVLNELIAYSVPPQSPKPGGIISSSRGGVRRR